MKAIKYLAVVTAILVVAILLKGEIQKSPVMAFIAGLCLMIVLIIYGRQAYLPAALCVPYKRGQRG